MRSAGNAASVLSEDDIRSWHKTDVSTGSKNVRLWIVLQKSFGGMGLKFSGP
jgi:hypothetical protein